MNGQVKSSQHTHPQIPRGRLACVGAICLAAFLVCGPTAAQEPDPEQETREAEAEEERSVVARLVDEADESSDETVMVMGDDCDWYLENREFQEKSQEVLRSWSCHTFRWFDGLFGDENDFQEEEVSGWLTFGGEYRDYDGFDGRLRLKVRSPLPNLSRRWDVWLGRFDEDAYLSDTQGLGGGNYTPGVVNRDSDDSWLLGMGHRRRGRKNGWDWNIGIRLNLPPEPYVKASYFYYRKPTEETDLRLRQTFFWRSDRGFGTTSRGDLTWWVNDSNVMYWEASGTVAEDTEGAKWYAGQTWYHLMENRHSFSLLAYAKGETDWEVELKDVGLNFIWRRPFTRDYIYLSMGPTLTWPREKIEEKRQMNLGFGVWLEIEFGDWRY